MSSPLLPAICPCVLLSAVLVRVVLPSAAITPPVLLASQQTAAVKADRKVSFEALSDSYYVASVTVDVDKDGKRYNNGTDSYTFTATRIFPVGGIPENSLNMSSVTGTGSFGHEPVSI
nr:hypothetical protein [Photorhabdus heterorhabditis]